jgi:hypothetical protein
MNQRKQENNKRTKEINRERCWTNKWGAKQTNKVQEQ